jgi:hypothetical protein
MDEVGDDFWGTRAGALAARQEDEPMAERRLGSSLDVGGDDEVPARGQRHGAGSLSERKGAARRRADGQGGVGPTGGDDVEDVTPYGLGHMDVADAAQQCVEVGSAERGTERVDE